MEKIKDIMYDISDIVISLIIVTVIFFVISWKLNESLPISYEATNLNIASKTTEDNQIPKSEDVSTDTTPEVVFTEEERPVENNTGSTVSTEVVEAPEVITVPVETPAPTTPSGQEVIFEVASGSTGFAIAKQLKEKGFINDINGFISTVETMGLGPKLRSGSFKLKTGMTEEQIINILAGIK